MIISFGINLTKKEKKLYNEKFKSLKKDISTPENERYPILSLSRINIVKLSA